jgi:hypothetical protein
MGCGKAQPLDAQILTPTGWQRMGALRLGDRVIGAQGLPISIIGLFPQGEKDIYRVTFSDCSSTECCADHLWRLQSTTHRFRGQPGAVMPLKDVMHDLRATNGNHRWYVPLVQPVAFTPQELSIDPYLLGLLIGDGSLTSMVRFSTADDALVASVQALLPPGLMVRHQAAYDYRITSGKIGGRMQGANALRTALQELGLAGRRAEEKFIPPLYLFGSIAQRTALLQGLLDTDGSVDRHNRIEFATTSEQLAQDMIALVQSLGGTARRGTKQPIYTYRGERRQGQISYRLTIALPVSVLPFRLERKANRYTGRRKYPPTRAMVAVTYVGRKPAQCIAVDAPDQLYVTDHYIVTHNTTQGIALAEVLRQLAPTNR